MPRTLQELIREMRRLTKGFPEAWKLTKRFEARAVPFEWDPDIEFDPDADFRIEVETSTRRESPVFVILLPEDAEAPADDALVWSRVIEHDDEDTHALFVADVDCHADWRALKVIHEYGMIEVQELAWCLAFDVARARLTPPQGLDYQLAPTVDHLYTNHEILISRLIDRGLRGAITSRVKTLKRSTHARERDDEALAESLVNDIRALLPRVWPKAANRVERHARYDLMKCAARGMLCQADREWRRPE